MFLRVSAVHRHFIIFIIFIILCSSIISPIFSQVSQFSPYFLKLPLVFPGFSQVLEVERLELDHFWEIHRHQLEQRDQETIENGGNMVGTSVGNHGKPRKTTWILGDSD